MKISDESGSIAMDDQPEPLYTSTFSPKSIDWETVATSSHRNYL